MTKQERQVILLEQLLRDQAMAFVSSLRKLNEIDPVSASGMYKQTMQYILENAQVNKSGVFTVAELEALGYL